MTSIPKALSNAASPLEPGQVIPIAEAYQIAVRCHQTGQLQQAATLYRQILQVSPDDAQVCYLLGAACQALGRFDEAAARLEHSRRLRPSFAEVHNHLGLVRVLQ